MKAFSSTPPVIVNATPILPSSLIHHSPLAATASFIFPSPLAGEGQGEGEEGEG